LVYVTRGLLVERSVEIAAVRGQRGGCQRNAGETTSECAAGGGDAANCRKQLVSEVSSAGRWINIDSVRVSQSLDRRRHGGMAPGNQQQVAPTGESSRVVHSADR